MSESNKLVTKMYLVTSFGGFIFPENVNVSAKVQNCFEQRTLLRYFPKVKIQTETLFI